MQWSILQEAMHSALNDAFLLCEGCGLEQADKL